MLVPAPAGPGVEVEEEEVEEVVGDGLGEAV